MLSKSHKDLALRRRDMTRLMVPTAVHLRLEAPDDGGGCCNFRIGPDSAECHSACTARQAPNAEMMCDVTPIC